MVLGSDFYISGKADPMIIENPKLKIKVQDVQYQLMSIKIDSQIGRAQKSTSVQKNALRSPKIWLGDSRDCLFCTKMQRADRHSFCLLLIKALYTKYSSSQNYFYSRDINDFLDQRMTSAVLLIRDLDYYIDEDEYLKRYHFNIINRWYSHREYNGKMEQLTEYYKFHRDIPRLFMLGICGTIHRFHDKKRRVEYARIKHQLGIQNEDRINSESTTPHNRKDRKESQDCSVKDLRYLLKGMETSLNKTDQQSCTAMLRDALNSIIQKNGMDNSFDSSVAFSPKVQMMTKRPKPKKNHPIIPNLNVDVFSGEKSHCNSPQLTPQLTPQLSSRSIQLSVPSGVPIHSKFKHQFLKTQTQQTLSQKNIDIQPVTARESSNIGNKSARNINNLRNFQPLTSRGTNYQLQKLMMPLIQKQIQQQLQEIKKKTKYFPKKSDTQDAPSPIKPATIKTFNTIKTALKPHISQSNLHFVQAQFQGIYQQKQSPHGSMIQKRASQTSTKIIDHLITSQPSSVSPKRPPSTLVFNSDNSIKISSKPKKQRVPSIYATNQNNLINIYLDDRIKNHAKSSNVSPLKSPKKSNIQDFNKSQIMWQHFLKKQTNA